MSRDAAVNRRRKRCATVTDVDHWLQLLASGWTVQQIAEETGFSARYIKESTR